MRATRRGSFSLKKHCLSILHCLSNWQCLFSMCCLSNMHGLSSNHNLYSNHCVPNICCSALRSSSQLHSAFFASTLGVLHHTSALPSSPQASAARFSSPQHFSTRIGPRLPPAPAALSNTRQPSWVLFSIPQHCSTLHSINQPSSVVLSSSRPSSVLPAIIIS